MLERFLTQRPNAPREDLAYLMERLDHEPLPAGRSDAAPKPTPAGLAGV